jgi:flagellar protein FliS
MNAANSYLAAHVRTASPADLILMLHNALIRHGQNASAELRGGRLESAHNALVRSQEIIGELIASLNFDADPELCQRLLDLYHYVHHNLADANLNHRPEAIDRALEIVRIQRDAWGQAARRLGEDADTQETSDNGSEAVRIAGPHSSSKSDWDLNSAYSSGKVWNV